MQNAVMPNVTIRAMDPETHATLVRRAAAAGQSLQQYLNELLATMAATPSREELLAKIERHRTGRTTRPVSTQEIVDVIREVRDE